MSRKAKPVFHLLMRIGKLLEARIAGRLAGAGVHHGQGRVLVSLHQHGPMTQADLARGLGCTPRR